MRFPVALAAGEIDVEHVDLVVARADLAAGPDQECAVRRLLRRELDEQRADMEMNAKLARQRPEARKRGIALLLRKVGE